MQEAKAPNPSARQDVGDQEGGDNDNAQGSDKDSGALSNEEDTAREGAFGTQRSHPNEQQ